MTAATTPDVCTVAARRRAHPDWGVGTCTVRVTAAATSNYDGGHETTATVTVNPGRGTQPLVVHAVTGDDIINRTEQADGFTYRPAHTGTEAGVTVTVTLGGHRPRDGRLGACPGRDRRRLVGGRGRRMRTYLTDAATSLTLTVAAAKTGYTSRARTSPTP